MERINNLTKAITEVAKELDINIKTITTHKKLEDDINYDIIVAPYNGGCRTKYLDRINALNKIMGTALWVSPEPQGKE